MLNFDEYIERMMMCGFENINIQNYTDYTWCEELWENYIEAIVIPNLNRTEHNCIRIIIMEACPQGVFPHLNYIFHNLNEPISHIRDKYLQQIYSGIFPQNNWRLITKTDALIQLAQQNIVLLDIFPFHGFNPVLNNRNNLRRTITQNLSNIVDAQKVDNIADSVEFETENIKLLFCLPNTYSIEAFGGVFNNYVNFGTITSGAGFPSNSLLVRAVNNGFNCR